MRSKKNEKTVVAIDYNELRKFMEVCGVKLTPSQLSQMLEDDGVTVSLYRTGRGKLVGAIIVKMNWFDEFDIQFVGIAPKCRLQGGGALLISEMFALLAKDRNLDGRHLTLKIRLHETSTGIWYFFLRVGFMINRHEDGIITLFKSLYVPHASLDLVLTGELYG